MRRGGRWLLAIATLAACVAPVPSPSSSRSSDPSSAPPAELAPFAPACFSVPTGTGECKRIADAVVARIDWPGTLVYVQVTAFGCEARAPGPCPPGFAARRIGEVMVETADPPRLRRFGIVFDEVGQVKIGLAEDIPSAVVVPASTPSGQIDNPFSLGHCGLFSPIDVDGSLWDPIADIDGDRAEAISSTPGKVFILAPRAGRFMSDSLFRADLLRRPGAKSVPVCE